MTEPILIETKTDMLGTYETRWMCEPPSVDLRFQVIDEEWNDEGTVRTIKKVKVCE